MCNVSPNYNENDKKVSMDDQHVVRDLKKSFEIDCSNINTLSTKM